VTKRKMLVSSFYALKLTRKEECRILRKVEGILTKFNTCSACGYKLSWQNNSLGGIFIRCTGCSSSHTIRVSGRYKTPMNYLEETSAALNASYHRTIADRLRNGERASKSELFNRMYG